MHQSDDSGAVGLSNVDQWRRDLVDLILPIEALVRRSPERVDDDQSWLLTFDKIPESRLRGIIIEVTPTVRIFRVCVQQNRL